MSDTLRQRAQAFLAAADKAPPAPWGLEIDFADDDWGHSHSCILGVKDAEGKLAAHFEDQPDNVQEAVALFALAARNDAPALVADLLAEVEVINPALADVTRRCKSLDAFASAQSVKVLDLQLANARQAAEITRLARELATAREQTALALARVEQLEQGLKEWEGK